MSPIQLSVHDRRLHAYLMRCSQVRTFLCRIFYNMCVNKHPKLLVLRAQHGVRGGRACRTLELGESGTCAWYSTECALVSSQRCPSSERTMNPEDVDVNCRLRCQGREKLGFECTHSTLTTAFMKVSCKHTSAYGSEFACDHLVITQVSSDAPFSTMNQGQGYKCDSTDSHKVRVTLVLASHAWDILGGAGMERKIVALAYVSEQAHPSGSIVTIIIVIQLDVIKREVFHQDVLLDDF